MTLGQHEKLKNARLKRIIMHQILCFLCFLIPLLESRLTVTEQEWEHLTPEQVRNEFLNSSNYTITGGENSKIAHFLARFRKMQI